MAAIKSKQVLAYARVSSLKQTEGSSLGDQLSRIEAYAAQLGLPVAHKYVEAESAGGENEENRTEALRLIREAQPGDLVVVDKLDRWSRDLLWGTSEARKLAKRGVGFFAIAEAHDQSKRENADMLGLHVWLAEKEYHRIITRLVGTRHGLRNRGIYSESRTPRGYARDKDGALVIDEEQAKLIRDVYKAAIGGLTQAELAAKFGVSQKIVFDLLNNKLYLGQIETSREIVGGAKPEWELTGEWIKATHPAIITQDLYDAARAAIKSRTHRHHAWKKGTGVTKLWILRDVAVCALCGAKMSAQMAGKTGTQQYSRVYYHCYAGCPGSKFIKVANIESMAKSSIMIHLFHLRTALAGPKKEATRKTDNKARRDKLAAKLARAVDNLTDGTISKDAYKEQERKISAELATLDVAPPRIAPDVARRALATLDGFTSKVEAALNDERGRAIANHLLVRVGMRPPVQGIDGKTGKPLFDAKGKPRMLQPAGDYEWRIPEDAITPEVLAPFLPRIDALAELLM